MANMEEEKGPVEQKNGHDWLYAGGNDGLMVKGALAGDGQDGGRVFSLVK